MPSFKGTVLTQVNLNGEKKLYLYRIREHDPVGLAVTAATVQGTDDVDEPEGSIDSPDVVAIVPSAIAAAFPVRSRVKVSWTAEDAGDLIGLEVTAG